VRDVGGARCVPGNNAPFEKKLHAKNSFGAVPEEGLRCLSSSNCMGVHAIMISTVDKPALAKRLLRHIQISMQRMSENCHHLAMQFGDISDAKQGRSGNLHEMNPAWDALKGLLNSGVGYNSIGGLTN
jgi:hypothetical protein